MSRRPIQTLVNDQASVLVFLQSRGVVPVSAPASVTMTLRQVHEATYSLILWKFRLSRIPIHGKVFVEEIASDALQVLPQLLMGYGKTTKLLIRGIIENALRHIYFSDHPVEFKRMNKEGKWYLKIEELLEYVRRHYYFEETEKEFDAVARLASLYSELSAAVHGRTVRDLEMRKSLKDIIFADDAARKDVAIVQRCAEAVNFLLATFHHEQVSKFSSEDRKIIMRTMPPKARQAWKMECK